MLVALLSVLSGFFFACHSVVIRMGLKNSDPMSATFISSLVNAVFLLMLSILFVSFNTFLNKGLIYLAIAGLLAPCLARVFLYTGMD